MESATGCGVRIAAPCAHALPGAYNAEEGEEPWLDRAGSRART